MVFDNNISWLSTNCLRPHFRMFVLKRTDVRADVNTSNKVSDSNPTQVLTVTLKTTSRPPCFCPPLQRCITNYTGFRNKKTRYFVAGYKQSSKYVVFFHYRFWNEEQQKIMTTEIGKTLKVLGCNPQDQNKDAKVAQLGCKHQTDFHF